MPWATLFLSVLLYIVAPLAVSSIWRSLLLRGERGYARLDRLLAILQPISLSALLLTLVLLFGFQGEQILAQPLVILLLAIPILIQVFFNSSLAYLLNRAVRSPHCVGVARLRAMTVLPTPQVSSSPLPPRPAAAEV